MEHIEKVYEIEIHEANENNDIRVVFGWRWYADHKATSSGGIYAIDYSVDDIIADLKAQLNFLEYFKDSGKSSFEDKKANYD